MAQQMTETYQRKTLSCKTAIERLGCDVNELIGKYSGIVFPDGGPDKDDCFRQVLAGTLSDEAFGYLERICSLSHHRDSRRPYEYGIDLMLGWLIEDAVLSVIQNKGNRAILSGEDRFREFLSPRQISTQPDIRIQFKSGERLLEVFADWKGTWRDANHADLRDNKYKRLKQEKAVMFGIAPLTTEGFLIDFVHPDNFRENFIFAYHKMGFTLKGVREILKPLNEIVLTLLNT